jgi:Endosomal/lysosomal potassium channel TMEM175
VARPAGAVAELRAYLVSFFIIGIIWVNHHRLFRSVARVDASLLFPNLLGGTIGLSFASAVWTLAVHGALAIYYMA